MLPNTSHYVGMYLNQKVQQFHAKICYNQIDNFSIIARIRACIATHSIPNNRRTGHTVRAGIFRNDQDLFSQIIAIINIVVGRDSDSCHRLLPIPKLISVWQCGKLLWTVCKYFTVNFFWHFHNTHSLHFAFIAYCCWKSFETRTALCIARNSTRP